MTLPFSQQLNVIHLPHRTDRYESFTKEFSEQGINFRIWDGVTKFEKPAQNINLAHKQIVRWAKEENLPYVIIAEDDIVFSHPHSWKYFIQKLPQPKDYDLYFSMIYSAEVKDGRIINGMSGLTMYAVSSEFYDFFLSVPDHAHLDRWLGQYAFEKRYLIIDKFVAFQSGGYTDNLKRHATYEGYMLDKEYYGREGQRYWDGKWEVI